MSRAGIHHTHLHLLAAHCAQVVHNRSAHGGRGATPRRERALPQKGSGECRVPVAPAAACAKVVSTRVSHHGRTGTPSIPARDGVNGFLRALPGDRALLSPSPADNSANLTPTIEAPGPHDFAVRKLARSSVAPSASIASRPYVRDDRETPLCVGRDGEDMQVIWVKSEPEYFCAKDWTTQIRLIQFNKLPCARRCRRAGLAIA
jgi:hypothetical protein